MASLNKVTLIGNLGADPEVRFTPGGQAVANFNIATNERWTSKNTGQPEERTEWHRIVVWGKQAENCRDYLSKGRQVYIEGRLQTRKWEDKQGQTRYTTEIVADRVLFLGAGPNSEQRERTSAGMTPSDTGEPIASAQNSSREGPPPFDSDEEIPF